MTRQFVRVAVATLIVAPCSPVVATDFATAQALEATSPAPSVATEAAQALTGTTEGPAPAPVTQAPAPVAIPPAPAPAAVTPAPVPTPVQVPAPIPPLPPMTYYASVAPEELLASIKTTPKFAQVDKELVGSPIQLRITHSLQPTAGGQAAGLLSAIWSGSTLGLLPVVTNNNLVLVYEVRVNGKEIARYDFQRSFTRAIAIWGAQNDPTYGLGEEGLTWAKSTATEFATKAAQDPALLALAQEYAFYFGSEKR